MCDRLRLVIMYGDWVVGLVGLPLTLMVSVSPISKSIYYVQKSTVIVRIIIIMTWWNQGVSNIKSDQGRSLTPPCSNSLNEQRGSVHCSVKPGDGCTGTHMDGLYHKNKYKSVILDLELEELRVRTSATCEPFTPTDHPCLTSAILLAQVPKNYHDSGRILYRPYIVNKL